jgi:hypothetical protein
MIRVAGHPQQFAMIEGIYIPDTQRLSDDAVRRLAGTYVEAGDAPIVRRDHCPTCDLPAPCDVRLDAVGAA